MPKRTLLITIVALLLSTQLLLIFPQGAISGIPVQSSVRVTGQGRTNGDVLFGSNVRITDHDTPYATQVEPTLAVLSNGTICAGWKEAQTHSGPGYRVGFSYSNDNGKTWSSNILMQTLNPGDRQSDPWLVADHQDNVYFNHMDWNDGSGASTIGVSKTVDGGASWLPIVDASDTGPGMDDKLTACVDPSGNLYVVWDWYADAGPRELTFTKSTDGGATFQPTTSIVNPYIPYITSAHNGTLFITTTEWPGLSGPEGQDVWITRSDDGGDTWSPQVRVTPLNANATGIISVVDTDSFGNVFVAYTEGPDWDFSGNTAPTLNYTEVYVTKSTDWGATWSYPIRINDVITGVQRMVELHVDENDRVHVAWLDARQGVFDIYYTYSDNHGATFHPNIKVTTQGTPLDYWRPGDYFTLRSGPNGVCLVWCDGRGEDLDIYFAAQDLTSPELEHTTLAQWWVNTPLTIQVSATDDTSLESAELWFGAGPNGPFYRRELSFIGDDLYEATLRAVDIPGPALYYHFIAYDGAGRTTRLPIGVGELFLVSLFPLSPTLVVTIICSVAVIALVIVLAVWYLRRTPSKSS